MGCTWVQLKAIKYVSDKGKQTTYYPGDWVCVGGQQARRWIAAGEAVSPRQDVEYTFNKAEIQTPPGNSPRVFNSITVYSNSLPIHETTFPTFRPKIERVCWFNPKQTMRPNVFQVGFHLIDQQEYQTGTWDMVAVLNPLDQLASKVGSQGSRDKAVAIMRDLRVPTYYPHLVFMRKTPDTMTFLKEWEIALDEYPEPLAFGVALYITKPRICALPNEWLQSRSKVARRNRR